ncbi:MAG: PAS domain S-box protein [Cytophagales bacterium]|nr:PAS domain S-box protein [Cytophagales bacterium]
MHTHHLLEELAHGFSTAAVGQAFFQLLAEHLSKALQVDYVFIGEFSRPAPHEAGKGAGKEKTVRSHVFMAKGQNAPTIQYPLVGSLCEYVVNQGFCAFPSQVQDQFPENQALKHFGVDSYAGIALFDSAGREAGIIYVMHGEPIKDPLQIEYLLKIVAKRVELELERVMRERELHETNEKLRQELAQRQQVEAELRKSEAGLRASNEALRTAQQALATLNAELEGRIGQRTEALHAATGRIAQLLAGEQAARLALERREKRLSSLVASQTNYLIRTDLEGRYTFVNGQFLEKFGLQAHELLGQSYFPTVHPDDLDQCRQMAAACIAEPGKVVPLQIRKWIGGQLYYTEWEFIGITGDDGQVAEIQGVGQDITARRQAEEERQKLIGDLTRKNHDLEQFAFITSHNLRAPVANMLGLATLYNAADPADPANQSVIEHFTLSAQRLDAIIQDLSDLLAVRKRQEERQRVELAEVVENARLSVLAQLEKSGAQLRVDLASAPVVYSVKTYVQSILLNLLSNALKYRAPERPPVVTLTARRRDGYVVVSVADNGLGIDLPRHGSRLFGLYKRFHAHTEGKGLGLYLVKTQAEALGGKVEVESTPGEGSTFRVYLPGGAPEGKSGF